jgi:hypothetical protein
MSVRVSFRPSAPFRGRSAAHGVRGDVAVAPGMRTHALSRRTIAAVVTVLLLSVAAGTERAPVSDQRSQGEVVLGLMGPPVGS